MKRYRLIVLFTLSFLSAIMAKAQLSIRIEDEIYTYAPQDEELIRYSISSKSLVGRISLPGNLNDGKVKSVWGKPGLLYIAYNRACYRMVPPSGTWQRLQLPYEVIEVHSAMSNGTENRVFFRHEATRTVPFRSERNRTMTFTDELPTVFNFISEEVTNYNEHSAEIQHPVVNDTYYEDRSLKILYKTSTANPTRVYSNNQITNSYQNKSAELSRLWISPDNTKLIHSYGYIHDAATCNYKASMGMQNISHIAFAGVNFYAASGDTIAKFNDQNKCVGKIYLPGPILGLHFDAASQEIIALHQSGSGAVSFVAPSTDFNTLAVQSEALNGLDINDPSAVSAINGILYIISKSNSSIARWSVSEQKFIDSFRLSGHPTSIYVTSDHIVTVGYDSGAVNRISFGQNTIVETNIYNALEYIEFLVESPHGIAVCARRQNFGTQRTIFSLIDLQGTEIMPPKITSDYFEPFWWSRVGKYALDAHVTPSIIRFLTVNAIDQSLDISYIYNNYESEGTAPMAFSPDQQYLAAKSYSGVNVFQYQNTNLPTYKIPAPHELYYPDRCNSLALTESAVFVNWKQMNDSNYLSVYSLNDGSFRRKITLRNPTWKIVSSANAIIVLSIDARNDLSFTALDFNGDIIPNQSLEKPNVASCVKQANQDPILTWSHVTGEESIILERRINDGIWKQIAQLDANTNQYTDLEIFPDSQVFYRVKFINQLTSSPYSDEIKLSTQPLSPQLSVLFDKSGRALISWNDVTDETSYVIERYQFNVPAWNPSTWEHLANLPTGSTSYLDVTAEVGKLYSYRITAKNDSNQSEPGFWLAPNLEYPQTELRAQEIRIPNSATAWHIINLPSFIDSYWVYKTIDFGVTWNLENSGKVPFNNIGSSVTMSHEGISSGVMYRIVTSYDGLITSSNSAAPNPGIIAINNGASKHYTVFRHSDSPEKFATELRLSISSSGGFTGTLKMMSSSVSFKGALREDSSRVTLPSPFSEIFIQKNGRECYAKLSLKINGEIKHASQILGDISIPSLEPQQGAVTFINKRSISPFANEGHAWSFFTYTRSGWAFKGVSVNGEKWTAKMPPTANPTCFAQTKKTKQVYVLDTNSLATYWQPEIETAKIKQSEECAALDTSYLYSNLSSNPFFVTDYNSGNVQMIVRQGGNTFTIPFTFNQNYDFILADPTIRFSGKFSTGALTFSGKFTDANGNVCSFNVCYNRELSGYVGYCNSFMKSPYSASVILKKSR